MRDGEKRTAPRKQPTQARSQATVDAIVTTAEQILKKRGLETLATAWIADAAGVTVGTQRLRAYFTEHPLVGAVYEQLQGLNALLRHRHQTARECRSLIQQFSTSAA